MANLFDIGKSGLLNYRKALGVTSENIANVNTEGYHRRSVENREMLASVATPTTTSNGGQGVKIDQHVIFLDRLRRTQNLILKAHHYKSLRIPDFLQYCS